MGEKGDGHGGKCSISSLDLKRKGETLTLSKRVIDLIVYRSSYGKPQFQNCLNSKFNRRLEMFWKRKETKEGEKKLPGPKGIHDLARRYRVVEEKKDPNWVWQLKGVVRPAGEKKAFYCRVFSEAQVAQAGANGKDWTSLDDPPDLILWEGYFDKETNTVRHEKFVKPSNSPN